MKLSDSPMTLHDLPLVADDAAKAIGVTPEWLIDAAQRGTVSHVKLPATGAYLFYPADLAALCSAFHRQADRLPTRARKAG